MIINLKESGDVVLFAEDSTKNDKHIFVYKLTNLDSCLCDDDPSDFYVAVPNGGNASIVDLPKGSYFVEKMNK